MSKQDELARVLNEIAQMLDVLGEDSFRSGAHSRAARIVEALTDDVDELAQDRARLLKIDGIGPKLADKIVEFCTTGGIKEHAELRGKVPPGLLALLDVPGLGPKTLHSLWKEGGVTDRASLERIIADGSILKLPRMGEKSVEKIKSSLAFVASGANQRLSIGLAMPVAEAFVERVKRVKGVTKVEFAGSLRRGKDTIGDIDILAEAPDAGPVIDAFIAMEGVKEILARGETKCSVRVSVAGLLGRWKSPSEPEPDAAGFQVDLRVLPKASWGAALMYFTGSKEHNVALRERAISMGMTLNEYGLFRTDGKGAEPKKVKADAKAKGGGAKALTGQAKHAGEELVAGKSEEEIYKALKLVYIPPELREARGELELQETPRLVEVSDIRAELHAHTTASDGRMSIAQLAEHAKKRGFHTIAVTDHSKSSAGVANGLLPERLRKHIDAVHRANDEVDGITILAGSEVDILSDGSLDYDDDLLAKLDVVVASPHVALSQEPAAATARLLKAIRHPLVHILGHPTGRLINRRKGLEPNMGELFAAAKEHGVALEINTHWMRLDLRDTHVRGAMEAGCVVAIDSDVHEAGDFENLRYGVLTARRGGVMPERCVNTWDEKKLHGWLKKKRVGR